MTLEQKRPGRKEHRTSDGEESAFIWGVREKREQMPQALGDIRGVINQWASPLQLFVVKVCGWV